ncbi:MAG: hypothetical protein SH857_18815, partial [Chitinophagales bacterium]|nr:hypothetical protein [Chitinophagales bacterium]
MYQLSVCRTALLLFTFFFLNFSVSAVAVPCDSTNLSVVVGYGGDNTNCQLPCNGQVYGNVTGGKIPYNYSWNNGATTQNQIGVCPGIYILMVVDADG